MTAAPIEGQGQAKSPQALISGLLTAKVAASQLPHGYASPVVGKYTPSAAARSHGAIGGVQILTDNGNDAVIYLVFASSAKAKEDWTHANFSNKQTAAAPKSLPKPSVVVDTSGPGTNSAGKAVTIGLTDVACLNGNVIVQSITSSGSSTKHGDLAGAVALEQFALAHLRAAK